MFLSVSGRRDAILPHLRVLVEGGLARVAVSSAAAARLVALGAPPTPGNHVHAVLSMKTVAKSSSGPVGPTHAVLGRVLLSVSFNF